jgi:tetratricopeptide (TPR) repeat protein
MRLSLILLVSTLAYGQPADPAYQPLSKAYQYLQDKQYDEAIDFFLKGIEAAPDRPAIRKDLAYAYLKVGEPEAARDQFAAAMRLDPTDFHVALEYAFLCNDTKMRAEARRVFDRIRKTGDAASRTTAEEAFQNIDQPLAAGIERWKKALELAPENFNAHFELAGLAEQRDDLALAAEHYARAWQLLPSRKQTLLDLGQVWKGMNRSEDANAALLAASRGGEPRAREAAFELLPGRYPYVNEFLHALDLDPQNIELRRELAFLLIAMQKQPEAEREFRIILDKAPEDLLSCAQLGFLYLTRDEKARAMPLLERVLKGSDGALANRVRAALKMPLVEVSEQTEAVSSDAKVMAERSLNSGYLNDALQFLQRAHEADPDDGWVMLKLGWTYNILHNDAVAFRWFGLARNSTDAAISAEARKAYNNLHPAMALFRTTLWLYPFFSTRWHDGFGYGQIKTDMKLGDLPFRPYVSMRFFGDSRSNAGGPMPQFLSESSVVLAVGAASNSWHGLMGWGEVGSAISYLDMRPQVDRVTADYRGGISYGKGFGHLLGAEEPGWFFEVNADGIYVSRYANDLLLYTQTRIGVTPPRIGALGFFQSQIFWNNNIIRDSRNWDWANYVETGPGLKFRWPWMPRSLVFSVSALRGAYTVPQFYRRPNFMDLRMGFWYAVTR